MKIVKPDYNQGLLNVMTSIVKYYGGDVVYPTHPVVDELLSTPQKHICVFLIDAMGAKLIERHLPEDSFLRRHMVQEITTVYPSTTAAATVVAETAEPPCKTGWTGWTHYFPEIDDHRVLFLNMSYFDYTFHKDNFTYSTLPLDHIQFKLTRQGVHSQVIYPAFRKNGAKTFDEMCDRILERMSHENEYTYCYWDAFDSLLHKKGVDCEEAIQMLKDIDKSIENLCSKLEEGQTLIVLADHGQIDTECVNILKYEDLMDCMRVKPSVECRASAFFIKEGRHEEFERLFKQYFGNDFILYTTDAFINEGYLGPFGEHPRLRELLGDYFACAIGKVNLIAGDVKFIGQHAGLTEDEMMIPLIVYQKGK
ncbi:MAG: alkaline phosphatase family protein [Erysipelotrichaceae bacterium]|nr:alkaline phosphatase family protein [Erysipelotrichaceae bacterium]